MAKERLTETRVRSLESGGPNRSKYLWDSDVAGLGVRAIGKQKYYLIQTRLDKKVVQIKMGDVSKYPLVKDARTEAYDLMAMIRRGIDPREVKRQFLADQATAKEARNRQDSETSIKALQVSDVWNEYIQERKSYWGELHYQDHLRLSQAGGSKAKTGPRILQPGPLAPLMNLTFAELTASKIDSWLTREAPTRLTQTRLALRLLKAFLNWCSNHDQYQIISASIITRKTTANLPKKQAKTDCLQREQLPGWFAAVRQIQNPVIAAYLQALLITGARREELAGLKWGDVDFRWKSITIHDKVEGQRVIPLTPFVEQILQWLPRRNQWVFSSPAAASGRLQEPFRAHKRALDVAGIEDLTIHGLRRSFGSLAEWVEVPVGIVAQIMGHKPSATAEKHYRVRPLDLLRMWHIKVEEWILEHAGVAIPSRQEEEESLKLVAAK
jgi:integrase